jgi:hypothetical protein
MIVPAVTLALALLTVLGIWTLCWDLDIRVRYAVEFIRYDARLNARQPYPTKADYDEALRAAMTITVRRNVERMDTLINERLTSDRFLRDAERAHGMLESALAGSSAGLRVVT